jgi:Tfp pilus assembly protein PilO
VTLTDRDRKILLALVPLAIVAAYWFLMLAPKREEAATIQDQLTQAESERDTAVQKADGLGAAKQSFARDYATVIYLGKSIPSTVDMPSLLVQLDRAARGTGIKFTSIQTGDRTAAGSTTTTGSTSTGSTAPASGSTPPGGTTGPASSGAPAQSGPGSAAQSAGGAVDKSNNASAASGGATDTTTSTTPGASTTGAPAESNSALDTVPLDFEFDGSFFDLADFFHRMKRFVRVANKNIVVRGRLMTINSFSFDAKESFPSLTATVHATVYLAPKAEGVSAGASPGGPSGSAPATPPAGETASGSSKHSNSPTPAATVTP